MTTDMTMEQRQQNEILTTWPTAPRGFARAGYGSLHRLLYAAWLFNHTR